MATCPTCKKAATRASAGKVFPFCSERCWQLDLGKWLSEEFRVPEPVTDESSSQLAAALAPGDDPDV